MTITVENSRVRHVANGAQVDFPFQFRVPQDEFLLVYVDDVLQTIVTHYSVDNSGNENGGTVTFNTAPADQAIVLIARGLPLKQFVDLIEYDRFPAETVEGGFDYVVMLIQQINDTLGTALTASPSIGDDVSLVLPAPGAGEFWKYADDGKSIETANIYNLGENIVQEATDQEIIDGTDTDPHLISPAQVKLGVETHETAPITSVFNVAWVSVVDVLPGTPDPDTLYLIRE